MADYITLIMSQTSIKIPIIFHPYVESALLRFSSLYPEANISQKADEILLTCPDQSTPELRQELLHLLYREKIYIETMDLRRNLFSAFSP